MTRGTKIARFLGARHSLSLGNWVKVCVGCVLRLACSVFNVVAPLPSRGKYDGTRLRKSLFTASTTKQKLSKQLCQDSGCQFSFAWRRLPHPHKVLRPPRKSNLPI